MIRSFLDKLENFVAQLGTGRDKASGNHYVYTPLNFQQLMSAYQSAWIAKKIVDVPAMDSVRRWREWNAESNEIRAIEETEKRLHVKQKVLQARTMSRLYGGAGILIGTRDTDWSQPIVPERLGRDGLRYLSTVSQQHMSVAELEDDVTSPNYGLPRWYEVSTIQNGSQRIHPSRVVRFVGKEFPDPFLTPDARLLWGDSVLQCVYEQMLQMDSTSANLASLVFEAKVDVVKIPNFMQGMLDEAYKNQVLERVRLASIAKGNNGTLILDSEEEYEQKTQQFSSLPEVVRTFMTLVAGAADIPATRLFGKAPDGMNATGEGDLTNYYDSISSEQEIIMSPAMYLLDECLIHSALGSRPDEVSYEWSSLWQMDDEQRSKIGKETAETIQIIANTNLVPEEPLARSAVNMLTERGVMPGLDAAVNEFTEQMERDLIDEDDVVDPDQDPLPEDDDD